MIYFLQTFHQEDATSLFYSLTDYLPQECLLSAVKGQREGDEGNPTTALRLIQSIWRLFPQLLLQLLL